MQADRSMIRGEAPDGCPPGLFLDRDEAAGITLLMSDGRRALALPISAAEARSLALRLQALARADDN